MDNTEINSSSEVVEEPETQPEAAETASSPADRSAPEPEAVELSAEQLSLDVEPSGDDTERARKRAMVEAAVYITDEPLTAKQLAEALELPLEEVKSILEELVAEYRKPEHGLTIREVAEGYKMGTKAEHHEAIRSFVKKLCPPLKLSMAALETLAVIAYKQPITAPEVMEIRGVQGAGVLKTLLDRKLITTAGRKQVLGRPILYKTSKEFLIQFGLKSLSELPTLKEFEELARMALTDSETGEDEPEKPPREKETEVPAGEEDTGSEAAQPAAESGEESDGKPKTSDPDAARPDEDEPSPAEER